MTFSPMTLALLAAAVTVSAVQISAKQVDKKRNTTSARKTERPAAVKPAPRPSMVFTAHKPEPEQPVVLRVPRTPEELQHDLQQGGKP